MWSVVLVWGISLMMMMMVAELIELLRHFLQLLLNQVSQTLLILPESGKTTTHINKTLFLHPPKCNKSNFCKFKYRELQGTTVITEHLCSSKLRSFLFRWTSSLSLLRLCTRVLKASKRSASLWRRRLA